MTRRLFLVLLLAVLGSLLCFAGLWWIFPPAALIAAGSSLVWLAFEMEV